MSAPSAAPAFSHRIQQADETAGQWLMGLLDGKGNTPSHVILTAVLGCVPVIGQLFDLRDLLRCIIALSASPANPVLWLDLLINLIGCIPGLGDAFKAGFTLARNGHNVNRVFDAMRSYTRINPGKALRGMDWGKVYREALHMLNGMLDNLIATLDRWLVQLVAGKQKANDMIASLKQVKQQAPDRLQQAIDALKKVVDDMLEQPLVASTAQVSGAQRSLPAPSAPRASTGQPQPRNDKPIVDNTGNNPLPRGETPTIHQIRQSKRKRWSTGVPAEHIVEYYVRLSRPGCRKINDHGRLIEEWESSKKTNGSTVRQSGVNSQGLDHLWFGQHKGRLYTVGETKGSTWAHFSFLDGMNENDKKALEGTRTDTAKILDGTGGYDPDAALSDDAPSNTYTTIDNEKALSDADKQTGTLSSTKGKGRQMSHFWIKSSIQNDGTIATAHKKKILMAIIDLEESFSLINCYNREVFMVTGKQYELHDRSKGAMHKVQTPIIVIPDNLLNT